MKTKMISFYMDICDRIAAMSVAQRLQVGSLIVKDDNILAFGWNGMPSGWDNCCEDIIKHHELGTCTTVSKAEVLHAEMNALMKLARSNESGEGATMFVTHSPCIDCAKGIYQAGIKEVYYKNDYRSTQGIEFLKQCTLEINKI
jgi:dCMP deaminase